VSTCGVCYTRNMPPRKAQSVLGFPHLNERLDAFEAKNDENGSQSGQAATTVATATTANANKPTANSNNPPPVRMLAVKRAHRGPRGKELFARRGISESKSYADCL